MVSFERLPQWLQDWYRDVCQCQERKAEYFPLDRDGVQFSLKRCPTCYKTPKAKTRGRMVVAKES